MVLVNSYTSENQNLHSITLIIYIRDMSILNFAKSLGFQVFCRQLLVPTGLIAGLAFSNVSMADNQRDVIGELILSSTQVTFDNQSTPATLEWRADIQDPIGQLLNETQAGFGGIGSWFS